ncbi:hypothetical protein NDU88_011812 [Pleurodeles waltl]|uniref:Uncharacterized protein n=1 Tax=Pleurodeles waltl TaxID=8319 RepID=A0AAV7R2F9_PLEWA|nr:hypothetical protein NDU88_011812 [Pleurodeles waltl]
MGCVAGAADHTHARRTRPRSGVAREAGRAGWHFQLPTNLVQFGLRSEPEPRWECNGSPAASINSAIELAASPRAEE